MGWIVRGFVRIPSGRDAGAFARALLSALRYRAHRRKTMAAATLLTGGYSRMPDLLLSRFPLGEAAIQGGFRHGESPEQAAAGLVGFVFSEVIEHDLSPEERKLISLQLQELHNQGKVLTGETTPLVHIIEWMLRISDQWVQGGKLEEAPRNVLTTEIYGALAGLSREERLRTSADADPTNS